MASKKTSITRRSGPSPTVMKLRSRLQAQSRRRSQEKKQRAADFAAVAGGAVLGFIDRQGWENPIDIPGVDDAAVYGVALYFISDRWMTGQTGEMVRGASVGMMAVAARDMVAG